MSDSPVMSEIERRAKLFADARADLAGLVTSLNAAIDQLKRDHLPTIKQRVNRCAERHAALAEAIEASPALFDQPRTQVFHGIKVGFKKGTGTIDFDDEDRVVALIEKHLADHAAVLIRTEKSVIKKALKNLSVADLKRIGCIVEETGDALVIHPVDTNVDKLVKALLKDALDQVPA